MAIVHSEKITESRRLNRCSAEASDFYTAMVGLGVPDDFGRFRDDAQFVHLKMYPRREPTPASLRRVASRMSELRKAGLWRTWDVDGVRFAEMYKWKPSGNLFHRTPEPPPAAGWPVHEHSKRCARTGAARARDWGDISGLKVCLRLLNKIGPTDPEGDPGQADVRGSNRGSDRPTGPSATSATSSPSSPNGKSGLLAEVATVPPTRDGQPPQAASTACIDHDPNDGRQALLAKRCVELATRRAALDRHEVTVEDVHELLYSVTTTSKGKEISGPSIRGLPPAWLEQSLRDCELHERDLADEEASAGDGPDEPP